MCKYIRKLNDSFFYMLTIDFLTLLSPFVCAFVNTFVHLAEWAVFCLCKGGSQSISHSNSFQIRLVECFRWLRGPQCSCTHIQPLSWVTLSLQVSPVSLHCALNAEYTKLSFPKAICDPSDVLAIGHGNASYSTVRYYILKGMLYASYFDKP